MMHKERLEEIKKELELDWSDISYVVNQVDVKWLINRVEELEDKCNYLSDMNEMLVDLNGVLPDEPELYIKLKKENKRYREAIKECVERMNEGGAGTRSFVYEKLSEALEGEK